MTDEKHDPLTRKLEKGLRKTKKKVSELAQKTSDWFNSFSDYEMDCSGDPSLRSMELGRFYRGFHNYIDVHIREIAGDHYSIFELIAVHDAIDIIISATLNYDDVLKEKMIIPRINEHSHLGRITWGYYYLHLMCKIFLDIDNGYKPVDADEIIRTIFVRTYDCGFLSGIPDFDFNHAKKSIALSYAKLTGRVVYPEISEKLVELVKKGKRQHISSTALNLKYLNSMLKSHSGRYYEASLSESDAYDHQMPEEYVDEPEEA